MKRQTTWLVEKRDGRRESLRATKLAHSIYAALTHSACSSRAAQLSAARAMDLARVVVRAVCKAGADHPGAGLPSNGPSHPSLVRAEDLSAAVPQVLRAAGLAEAAALHEHSGRRTRAGARRARAAVDAADGGRVSVWDEAAPLRAVCRTVEPRSALAPLPGACAELRSDRSEVGDPNASAQQRGNQQRGARPQGHRGIGPGGHACV